MNKIVAAVAALSLSLSTVAVAVAVAQVVPAAKDAGKATAETARQAKENVQGAVSSEPDRTVHKAKARVHKAKAKSDATAAKDATVSTVK